jgi:hypothetical protein
VGTAKGVIRISVCVRMEIEAPNWTVAGLVSAETSVDYEDGEDDERQRVQGSSLPEDIVYAAPLRCRHRQFWGEPSTRTVRGALRGRWILCRKTRGTRGALVVPGVGDRDVLCCAVLCPEAGRCSNVRSPSRLGPVGLPRLALRKFGCRPGRAIGEAASRCLDGRVGAGGSRRDARRSAGPPVHPLRHREVLR